MSKNDNKRGCISGGKVANAGITANAIRDVIDGSNELSSINSCAASNDIHCSAYKGLDGLMDEIRNRQSSEIIEASIEMHSVSSSGGDRCSSLEGDGDLASLPGTARVENRFLDEEVTLCDRVPGLVVLKQRWVNVRNTLAKNMGTLLQRFSTPGMLKITVPPLVVP